MLGMGLTITPNDFKMVLKAPRAVIIGVCLQFSIMPTLAFIIAKSFHLPDICCWRNISWMLSGGTSSNVMSYLAKANVALSVSITTVSTLLAPFVIPALIYLFANEWLEVSFLSMLWSVVRCINSNCFRYCLQLLIVKLLKKLLQLCRLYQLLLFH